MSSTNDRTRSHGQVSNHPRPNSRSPHPKGGLPPPKKQHRSHAQPVSPKHQQEVSPWGQRTSATMPNPVPGRPQPGRVRVQAGDKCVPPAKSKHKKRIAVPGRPVDLSSLSMDAIIWSDESYDVTQLMNSYGKKLPVIIKVVEGYHTKSGEDLSVNQVVQVHSYDHQDRVRTVTQTEHARLSLPADYPLELFIRQDNLQERRTLKSALVNKSLPLKVLVTSVNESIEVSTVNVVGKHMTITEKHREIFVKINTITDGWIDQKNIHAIPGFLGAKFVVAVGMRGASEDEWADYYGMFARSVRHLNFHLLRGYDGIIIEEDDGGTIQLEPPTRNNSSGPVYENLGSEIKRASTLDSKPSTSNNRLSHPYENWSKESAEKAVLMRGKFKSEKIRTRPTTLDTSGEVDNNTGFDAPPASDKKNTNERQNSQDGILPEGRKSTNSPKENVVMRLPNVTQMYPEVNSSHNISPRRPGTPFSEVDESEVEEMFQSVLDVAEEQETLKKQKEQEKRKKYRLEMKAAELKAADERAEVQAKLDQRTSLINSQLQQETVNETELDNGTDSTVVDTVKEKESIHVDHKLKSASPSHAAKSIFEINNPPSYRSSSSSRDSKEVDPVRSVEALVHRDPSPRASKQVENNERDPSKYVYQSEQPMTKTGQSFGSNSNIQGMFREMPVKKDKSPTPKAVVQPTIKQPALLGNNRTPLVKISITDTTDKVKNNDINSNYAVLHSPSEEKLIQRSALKIQNMDDVPKMIDSLTVEETCQCLQLLNMDSHLSDFRKHQVDGNLLASLRENVLINDFHFTPFNASKLMRFVRGWRPKIV